jgi:dTDP-4-amino-4,6-dideoxygalactose transaminase
MDKPIFVTQPFLPPIQEFIEYIEKIWESKQLTNNGPFHQELEKALCDYLGVEYISVFSNGTLALITALHALPISGEVITTPFSFVASTHCLHWNDLQPVFCDIENDYFSIDPGKIEALITPKTSAILAVHVYGNPCYHKKLQKIADKHKLRLIYDAAHAFGVKKDGKSICNWGDLSILSFHATKVYNTFEGGAIICHDEQTKKRIDLLKNFGFADEVTIVAQGMNAKMNEIQAAMGLLQLKYVDKLIDKRKYLTNLYRELLSNTEGIRYLNDIDSVQHNYSYFPILIDKEKVRKTRDEVYEHLKKYNIFSRRYFYPLISQFPPYNELESAQPGKMPVAEKVAEQVLCLPLYPDLEVSDIIRLCEIIKGFIS